MKRFTKNSLKTGKTSINLVEHNGHLYIMGYASKYGRNFRRLTSIKADLTLFEKRAVLIHIYKAIEANNALDAFRNQLGHMNYAEVFGSPWN